MLNLREHGAWAGGKEVSAENKWRLGDKQIRLRSSYSNMLFYQRIKNVERKNVRFVNESGKKTQIIDVANHKETFVDIMFVCSLCDCVNFSDF